MIYFIYTYSNSEVSSVGKKFNISGTCLSDRHYMVDPSSRLEKIGSMVENGEYFVVNRARQYGKTTLSGL